MIDRKDPNFEQRLHEATTGLRLDRIDATVRPAVVFEALLIMAWESQKRIESLELELDQLKIGITNK